MSTMNTSSTTPCAPRAGAPEPTDGSSWKVLRAAGAADWPPCANAPWRPASTSCRSITSRAGWCWPRCRAWQWQPRRKIMSEFIDRCRGSSAALPTPYSLGKVDFDALEAFCNRLIDRGISALVPCGTTGEAPLLTADEHHRVVARTVAAAAGRVPVIAGAGSNNTATAVELARSAERAGASALLCVTPPYLKPTQAGMMVHFRTIHDAVGIPIILYDVPSRTACALDDVTIRRLAELPRIVGLKDATGTSLGSRACAAGWATNSCCCRATTPARRRSA